MSVLVPFKTETDLQKIVTCIQQLAQGRSNAVNTFTLTANAASTVVTSATCGEGSVIFYMPTTAHASAEIGAGTIYIATVANGSFTVTHANNAQTDRIFKYAAIG